MPRRVPALTKTFPIRPTRRSQRQRPGSNFSLIRGCYTRVFPSWLADDYECGGQGVHGNNLPSVPPCCRGLFTTVDFPFSPPPKSSAFSTAHYFALTIRHALNWPRVFQIVPRQYLVTGPDWISAAE